MHIGFSYVGLIFLCLLLIPNLFWIRHQPKNYQTYAKHENKILLLLERAGEVSVSCIVLIFSDFNIHMTFWSIWLLSACIVMIWYELYWTQYFKSAQTMHDFYHSFLGIPVAGATLPVIAFGLLSVYGKNPFLMAAVCVLGIGHIGIHIQHKKEILS